MSRRTLAKARAELRDLLIEHPALALELPPSCIDPARHYRPAEVGAFLGVSTSTFYKLIQVGKFPQPLRRGTRHVYWPGAVVIAELERLAQEDAQSAETAA